jgi:hypothetical protein
VSTLSSLSAFLPSLFLLCYYTQQPASSLSLPSPYIPMIDSCIISALLGFFFERTHMSRLGPCLRAQARLLRCLLDVVWSVRTRVRIICERWCSNQDMGKNTTQEGVWQPVWQVLCDPRCDQLKVLVLVLVRNTWCRLCRLRPLIACFWSGALIDSTCL